MIFPIPLRFSSSDPEYFEGSSRSFSIPQPFPRKGLGHSNRTFFLLFLFFFFLACTPVEQRPPPDLLSLDQTLGFSTLPVSDREHSLLKSVLPEEPFQSAVLLQAGERQAAVFYSGSLHAAEELRALKTHVYQIASAEFTDFTDERMERPGFRAIELFAFSDPSLLDERFVFARMENTLYEFHVPEGKEGWVLGVLSALAKL